MQKLATRKEEPIARPSTAFPPSDAALPASSLSLSQLGLNYIEGGALLGGRFGVLADTLHSFWVNVGRWKFSKSPAV